MQVFEQDLRSRQQTVELTRIKVKAGFTAAADGALIDATVADASQKLIAAQADCDLQVKALVALTGLEEGSTHFQCNK